MNVPGSFFFCSDDDCGDNLGFKPGVRKACRNKRKFYTSARHKCRATDIGVITKDLADEHNIELVSKGSAEGKRLQQQTGWKYTDFLIVPEDSGVRPTKVNKRKVEQTPGADLDEDAQEALKKQVMPCNNQYSLTKLYMLCANVCRRPVHVLQAKDEAWANQLCSAACCWLAADDTSEALDILHGLLPQAESVLLDKQLTHCRCVQCRTALAVIAYKV